LRKQGFVSFLLESLQAESKKQVCFHKLARTVRRKMRQIHEMSRFLVIFNWQLPKGDESINRDRSEKIKGLSVIEFSFFLPKRNF
jgi:hypothetical protein